MMVIVVIVICQCWNTELEHKMTQQKMLKRPLAKFQNKIMSTQTLYQRSGIFTCANNFIQQTKSIRCTCAKKNHFTVSEITDCTQTCVVYYCENALQGDTNKCLFYFTKMQVSGCIFKTYQLNILFVCYISSFIMSKHNYNPY